MALLAPTYRCVHHIVLLLALGTVGGTERIASPPTLHTAYDTSAYLITLDQAPRIQEMIDKYKIVRLESVDYRLNITSDNITLGSGMEVYGLPGTELLDIIVAPGTTGSIVSCISMRELYFPPSSASSVTQFNTFTRLSGVHVVFDSAHVSDLLFMEMTQMGAPFTRNNSMKIIGAGIEARGSASVLNSRFVRSMVHSPGATLSVNLSGTSSPNGWKQNTLLWQNSLGAMQDTYYVNGAEELTVVLSDIESYGAAFQQAALVARNTDTIRFYAMHGRIEGHNASWNESESGIIDADARVIQLLKPVIDRDTPNDTVCDPEIRFGARAGNAIQLQGEEYSTQDLGPESSKFRLSATASGTTCNGKNVTPGVLPITMQQKFQQNIFPSERQGSAWGIPTNNFSKRLGSILRQLNPTQHISKTQDATDTIQALINRSANHTATLPSGVYYISQPLRVGRGKYLVGDGPDKTIIRALDPSMAMVVGDGSGGSGRFHVAGVTFEDGAVGIHMGASTGGFKLQVTESFLSHITFRNFSKAGIFLDDIYGLDNNLLSYITFDNCFMAFYQYAPASQREPNSTRCLPAVNNPNLGYMDKTVFYRNVIINSPPESPGGFLLHPCRADNGNLWFETYFDNVPGTSLLAQGNNVPIVASCAFRNSSDPFGNVAGLGIFNSLIEMGKASLVALPLDAFIEGSKVQILADGLADNASLFPTGNITQMTLMHNRFEDIPFGNVDMKSAINSSDGSPGLAMYINNQFVNLQQQNLNKLGLVITGITHPGGTINNITICGRSSQELPESQLLFGGDW